MPLLSMPPIKGTAPMALSMLMTAAPVYGNKLKKNKKVAGRTKCIEQKKSIVNCLSNVL